MLHLIKDAGQPIYGISGADLHVWIGALLPVCDLAECLSHFLLLPGTGESYLLSGKHVLAQVGRRDFDHC